MSVIFRVVLSVVQLDTALPINQINPGLLQEHPYSGLGQVSVVETMEDKAEGTMLPGKETYSDNQMLLVLDQSCVQRDPCNSDMN